jgi:outer membrane murein-binding lipoprotein Lpp
MATETRKIRCITCGKEKATSKCSGCLEDFCFNHLAEHRQQLGKQFDELENKRNLFRQALSEQTTNP